MKIGFIGAGRCGMSLARYFAEKGLTVCGVYSRRKPDQADIPFMGIVPLIEKSDMIFVTVTDRAIAEVRQSLAAYDLRGKILCHCSGSLTSDALGGGDLVCSVHPMLAFNSTRTPVSDIEKAFFTLEGGKYAVHAAAELLNRTGNSYRVIDKANKAKYHAAACFASNFVVAVCDKAEKLLTECGFTAAEAHHALSPLMLANMENIIKYGTAGAITGPAARRDLNTIAAHKAVLGEDNELYTLLTQCILDM